MIGGDLMSHGGEKEKVLAFPLNRYSGKTGIRPTPLTDGMEDVVAKCIIEEHGDGIIPEEFIPYLEEQGFQVCEGRLVTPDQDQSGQD